MIKIFLENVCTLDFAYLPNNTTPIGKSFFINLMIQGETNSNGMLIDFSEAKEILKSCLNDFDHKLLVSHNNIKLETNTHFIVSSQRESSHQNSSIIFENKNFFAMYAKSSWIKIIPQNILESICDSDLNLFEEFISKILLSAFPKNITAVTIKFKRSSAHRSLGHYFHYTHTICNHKGHCQRFHGHSAQISVFENDILNTALTQNAIQKLNGSYIVSMKHVCDFNKTSDNIAQIIHHSFKENEFRDIQNDLYAIEYPCTDGIASILISKSLSVLLSDESTIENIAQYLYFSYKSSVKICVYEGLTKGAMIE